MDPGNESDDFQFLKVNHFKFCCNSSSFLKGSLLYSIFPTSCFELEIGYFLTQQQNQV